MQAEFYASPHWTVNARGSMRHRMPTNVLPILKELKRLGMTQAQIGAEVGVDQSTVNRWLKGSRPEEENLLPLLRLAERRGIRVNHRFDLSQEAGLNGMQSVPVIGYVGAGAAVIKITEDSASDTVETIDVPIGFGDVQAVIVRGDSMFPLFKNGDILCFPAYDGDIDALVGKECLIITADNEWLVKTLERGSKPRHYHLLSYNGSPIRDVTIRQACPIRYIFRA